MSPSLPASTSPAAPLTAAVTVPTVEEWCDALWLVAHKAFGDWQVSPSPPPPPPSPPPTGGEGKESGQPGGDDPEESGTKKPKPAATELAEEKPPEEAGVKNEAEARVFVDDPNAPTEPDRQRGIPIVMPGGRALPGGLALARALRPLKRRVPSRTEQVFDEDLTAERIATDRLYLPQTRPAKERWLEVVLVVDRHPSMLMWQQTLYEFQLLLERQGAFRDVRVWHLHTAEQKSDEPARVVLRAPNSQQIRSPRELIEPTGRRVVLVASACIGAAWDQGVYPELIHQLGAQMPVALLQLLPPRRWSQTAMETARRVLVSTSEPGLPNQRLRVRRVLGRAPAAGSFSPVPVVMLDPSRLTRWARLVAGSPGALASAAAFDHALLQASAAQLAAARRKAALSPTPAPAAEAERRVKRFCGTSGELAIHLASLLAAAPLTLPIMRLVQQTLLPQSQQSDFAEVFLGGLFRRLTPEGADENPDTVMFEFHPGVRRLLLERSGVPDQLQVLEAVSNYLQLHLGTKFDIRAFLADPAAVGAVEFSSAKDRHFANISAEVLERAGYRHLSDALRQETVLPPPDDELRRVLPAGQHVTLTVELGLNKSGVVHLESTDLKPRRSFAAAGVSRDKMGDWIHRREQLLNSSTTREEELHRFGRELAAALLPRPLEEWLWNQRRAIASILVVGGLLDVPWELIVLSPANSSSTEPMLFLAELGLVRWPGGVLPPREVVLHAGNVRSVFGDYPTPLDGLQDERQLLSQRLDAWNIEGDLDELRDSIKRRPVDLLHMAGHGVDGQFMLSNHASLSAADLKKMLADREVGAPVFVLNFDDSVRFASTLLECGASALVSAHSSLPDVPATRFVDHLYAPWLDGIGLAESSRRARAALRRDRMTGWLHYVVFGNPLTTLRFERQTASPFAGKRILWVDDNPANNDSFRPRLLAHGAEVVEARSTQEALEVLARESFDAVISDMDRPEGPYAGLDLLDRLRTLRNRIPFVIFSGYQGPRFAQQTRAHLGQLATNKFDEVVAALLAAFQEPSSDPQALPPESIAALQEIFRRRNIDIRLETHLTDPALWELIWDSVRTSSDYKTRTVLLVELAQAVARAPRVGFYDRDSGRLRFGLGDVYQAQRRTPQAARLALQRKTTVALPDERDRSHPSGASDFSELAIPIFGPDGKPDHVLYLESPLPLAFGPGQVASLEELARSAEGRVEFESVGRELPKPSVPAFRNDSDDRCKGAFGGKSATGGREVIAVTATPHAVRSFVVDFVVRSTDGSPLEGPVRFFLHQDFIRPFIQIRKINAGEARLAAVRARGVFTLGVQVLDANRRWISLELDLADHIRPPVFAAFLFQSSPRLWSLEKNLHAGGTIAWKVTRHKKYMLPGQLVLFWSAQAEDHRDTRGLWGWGIVTGKEPRRVRGVDRLDVLCIERWTSAVSPRSAPVPATDILSLLSWQRHALNTMAAGTNFVVEPAQLGALLELVVNQRFPRSQFGLAVQRIRADGHLDPRQFSPQTLAAQSMAFWLLMADVVGFRQLRRRAAASAATQLEAWQAELRRVIERHGGRVARMFGDSLLATWSESDHAPGDVAAAVRAIERVRQQAALPFRFALHFGEFSDRQEKTSTEADVDFTYRMEKRAKRLNVPVLLSEPAVLTLGLNRDVISVDQATIDGVRQTFYTLSAAAAKAGPPKHK